jgi:hypothetical protein
MAVTLPPKAIRALVELKEKMLIASPSTEEPKQEPLPLRAEHERKTPERTMRHARIRGNGYQRFHRQMNERFARL